MKKTLCALVFALNSIIGCEDPVFKQPEGGEAITIPYDCVEVKCLSEGESSYFLTCKDIDDKTIYYKHSKHSLGQGWNRYDLIKENKK